MNASFRLASRRAWSPVLLASFIAKASAEQPVDPGQPKVGSIPQPALPAAPAPTQSPDPTTPRLGLPYPKAAPDQAQAYLQMHTAVTRTESPTWTASLHELEKKGDYGTVLFLKELSARELDPAQQRAVDRVVSVLESRTKTAEQKLSVRTLVERLERAALADVSCHRLEITLVRWAQRTVRGETGRPEVRAALEELARGADRETGPTGLDDAYRSRLASYARTLLKEQPRAGVEGK